MKIYEAKWAGIWEAQNIYGTRLNSDKVKFIIDGGPPTLSGNLHIGHLVTYIPIDAIARFKRMQGFEVIYPMGWDSNGFPTHNLIKSELRGEMILNRENMNSVCDNFVQCGTVPHWKIWSGVGLGLDRNLQYHTMDTNSRRDSQIAFLKLLKSGFAYSLPPGSNIAGFDLGLYSDGNFELKFADENGRPAVEWIVNPQSVELEVLKLIKQIKWLGTEESAVIRQFRSISRQQWPISRTRDYGVPIPVWYPLDEKGEPLFGQPILPDLAKLPIDPQVDTPPNYTNDQRGKSNGFTGEHNSMDTWMTSTITFVSQRPDLIGNLTDKLSHFTPAHIRTHGQDITEAWTIRSLQRWAMLDSGLAGNQPFHNVIVHGVVLDKNGSKMSKSVGNSVEPNRFLTEFGGDITRYWALTRYPGKNTKYDHAIMDQVGKNLIQKLINLGKYEGWRQTYYPPQYISYEYDKLFINYINHYNYIITSYMNEYKYHLAVIELSKLVKEFSYFFVNGTKRRMFNLDKSDSRHISAVATYQFCLEMVLKLSAPFFPFASEEVWSRHPNPDEATLSIHLTSWPRVHDSHLDSNEFKELRRVMILYSQIVDSRLRTVGRHILLSTAQKVKLRAHPYDIKLIQKYSGRLDLLFELNLGSLSYISDDHMRYEGLDDLDKKQKFPTLVFSDFEGVVKSPK
ncbi:MAG: class I tRNA ligase family protein [Bdellovibrionales bacterium]|nr:class I tRNA ligase family protein [Bdellovibrionales bacterium]